MAARRVVVAIFLVASSSCYRGVDAAAGGTDDSAGDTADDTSEGESDGAGTGGTDDGVPNDSDISECRRPSQEVYLALAPTCGGCHGVGSNFAAFASFEAFERLIAYDPSLVVPGAPDDSPLLDLLAGTAPPPLKQMPPGISTFSELEADGLTDISVDDVRAWIEAHELCELPAAVTSPRFAQRVDAEHVRAMLLDQLDLSLDDIYYVFPVADPDFPSADPGENRSAPATARWRALGGPRLLTGDVRNSEWNPLFLQTVGPMAQAWCRKSIELGRTALFEHATADSTSASDAAGIRANIEYLYLRLQGLVANGSDVDAMYEDVFLPYESSADSTTAWTAVCAAMIRDPLWLSR